MKFKFLGIILLAGCASSSSTNNTEANSTGIQNFSPVEECLASTTSPRITNRIDAIKASSGYPAYLRQQNISGTVQLLLLIDGFGEIQEAKAVVSPHPELSKVAVNTAKEFDFEPGKCGNISVPMYVSTSLSYVLQETRSPNF